MSIEPGKYIARATSANLGYTKGGKEQIAVTFKLSTGESITWYGSFSDAAFDRTIKSLRACGWQGDDLSQLGTALIQNVELVIDYEDDLQGKPRPKVKWVNELGGGGGLSNPMSPKQAADFARRMKPQLATAAGGNREPRRAEPRARRQAPESNELPDEDAGEDDIPFS